MTDLLGKIDVVSEVEGPGGKTVIPRVVRHGVALAIAALFPEHFEKLRLGKYFYKGFLRSNVECKETVCASKFFLTQEPFLAGLLTRDPRRKERNKVNQPGARAKWTW